MRSVLLASLMLAVLVGVTASVQAQTVVTDFPAGSGTFTAAFSIFGESFTTPSDNVLNTFAYQLDNLGPLTLSIYAYNDTTNMTVGSPLFTSALTASSTVQGQSGYAFTTGNLSLTSGSVYAALLSGSAGYSGPIKSDVYAGGKALAGNSVPGPLNNFFSGGFDTLFRAEFTPAAPAVPEPGTIALLTGLSLTGAAFLRRRKAARKAL